MSENWINHPSLSTIDKEKLQLLQSFAEEGSGKNISDLFPLLLTALNNGKRNGLSFSEQEINAILKVLKEGKSSRQQQRIEKIISLIRNL